MLVVTEEASEPVSPYKERVDCDVSLVLGIQNSPDLQLWDFTFPQPYPTSIQVSGILLCQYIMYWCKIASLRISWVLVEGNNSRFCF